MKNTIIQSSLIFGALYVISIIAIPSVELISKDTSINLNYSFFYKFLVFSIFAALYYLKKNEILKFENGAKMALILSIIIIVFIVDLFSWYFIGIYEYQGTSNFIFLYLLTVPMYGGFTLFISIFIAEFIWGKVKTH